MKNKKQIIMGSVLALIAGGILISRGVDGSGQAPAAPAIPVITTKPAVEDITVYVDSLGTLLPSVWVDIIPEVDGTLQEVLVSEGQQVEKGTPLFKIDSKVYEIHAQEAKAQLTMDYANLDAAQKKLNRFKSLKEKDLIAQTEWDELESEAARCKARIDLDLASLASAELNLDRCIIKSPINGIIGKLDIHPGSLLHGGQTTPLTNVFKLNPLVLEFAVTEKEFSKIPQGALSVEIQSICNRDSCYKGTVTFLDHHFDTATGLLLARGTIQNENYALRPGQTVQVSLPISVISNACTIPQKTVRYNQQGPYVYVVNGEKCVELRQITTGIEKENDVVVTHGLEPSETIILEGHLRLSPGAKVELKS